MHQGTTFCQTSINQLGYKDRRITYPVTSISIEGGSREVEESTNQIVETTSSRIESSNGMEVGKGMSGELPGLGISAFT